MRKKNLLYWASLSESTVSQTKLHLWAVEMELIVLESHLKGPIYLDIKWGF